MVYRPFVVSDENGTIVKGRGNELVAGADAEPEYLFFVSRRNNSNMRGGCVGDVYFMSTLRSVLSVVAGLEGQAGPGEVEDGAISWSSLGSRPSDGSMAFARGFEDLRR